MLKDGHRFLGLPHTLKDNHLHIRIASQQVRREVEGCRRSFVSDHFHQFDRALPLFPNPCFSSIFTGSISVSK